MANVGVDSTATLVLTIHATAVPVSSLLTGVVFVQWARFMTSASPGKNLLRGLASFVTLIVAIAFCVDMMLLYHYADTAVSDSVALLDATWHRPVQSVLALISGVTVQTYFCVVTYRMLNKSMVWAVFAGVILAAILGGALSTTRVLVEDVTNGRPPKIFSGKSLAFPILWLGSAAALDISLSVTLCRILFGMKTRLDFSGTRDVISTLLIILLEGFTLTASAALTSVILACLTVPFQGSNILKAQLGSAVTSLFILTRLYAMSLLFTLTQGSSNSNWKSSQSQSLPVRTEEHNCAGNVLGGVRVRVDVASTSDQAGEADRTQYRGDKQAKAGGFDSLQLDGAEEIFGAV